MKLNHLDLQVSDVRRSVSLFCELFGLQLTSNAASPAIAFLTDGEGFTLVLQKKKDDAQAYPEGFHFGFLVDDPETVSAFQLRAKQVDGVQVSDVIVNGRGTLVYANTWDGILIEVSCRKTARALSPTES